MEIDRSWPRAVRSFNSYCFLIKFAKEIPRPTESVTATPPITPSVASTVVPLLKLQIGDGTPPVASTLVPLSKLQVGSHCQRKSYPHQSGARGGHFCQKWRKRSLWREPGAVLNPYGQPEAICPWGIIFPDG